MLSGPVPATQSKKRPRKRAASTASSLSLRLEPSASPPGAKRARRRSKAGRRRAARGRAGAPGEGALVPPEWPGPPGKTAWLASTLCYADPREQRLGLDIPKELAQAFGRTTLFVPS